MVRDKPEDLGAIKNLLILQLLNAGISPEIIGKAIGTAPKTIRNMFPMKKIKKGVNSK